MAQDNERPAGPWPAKVRRGRHLPAKTRCRRVAELIAEGWTEREIAEQLGARRQTVRRDVVELRKAASRRKPWRKLAAARAVLVEAAEAVIQKVRRAQQPLKSKEPSRLYADLLALEWTMLAGLLSMVQAESGVKHPRKNNEEASEEETECESAAGRVRREAAELLREAREAGIETSEFEGALRAAGALSPENGAPGPPANGDDHPGEERDAG